MKPDQSLEVRFYTRAGCHLCDRAFDVVEKTRSSYPFRLTILNVEEDPRLEEAYGHDIPVVEIQGAHGTRTLRHRLEPESFEEEIRRSWNT